MADAENRSLLRVPKLDEVYNTWALLLKAHLVTKELPQPIEEPPPPEREAAALERYNRKDRKALAVIILGVKAQHLPTLAEARTARQAWEALVEAFQRKTSARKVQLTLELATLRMGDGEALMTYVGRAKTLRAELGGAGHPVGQDTAVMHVLAGLPPAYKTVTTVLLAAGVSLQWDQLLAALLPVKVEQKEAAYKGGEESSVAYGAYRPASSGGRSGSRASAAPGAKQVLCWYCNKPGHRRHECRKLAADKMRRDGGGGVRGWGPDDSPFGAVAFTTTVMEERPPTAAQAEAASQSKSRNHGQHTWIVDSGATHHMTNKYSNLAIYVPTDGCFVTLASGETAEAVGKGYLLLTPRTGVPFAVHKVLYVPILADNLLSVRAVTRHGGAVNFIADICAVLSSSTLVVTGTPKRRNQYEVVVEEKAMAPVAYGQASSEVARLWHRRYCHFSSANLRTVSTLVKGMEPVRTTDVASLEGALCHPCVVGRMHAEPFHTKDVGGSAIYFLKDGCRLLFVC